MSCPVVLADGIVLPWCVQSSCVLVLISGKLIRLRELLLSYNRVQFVPEELSCCESLERLELAMNRDLNQLPDQVQTTP